MRFLFLTKTLWSEPPRLRHQLARLLKGAGHEVVFFEKPRYPWVREAAATPDEPGIRFRGLTEILHHKLRVLPPLRAANAAWVKRDLSRAVRELGVTSSDVVVNFNYDYDFLRKIFPGNRLITIINDDFPSRALPGTRRSLEKTQERTCRASDAVLTVSPPLQRQLNRYCDARLFMPWADENYETPATDVPRDTLLFWGYIDWKIDYVFVASYARALMQAGRKERLLFAGPVDPGSQLQSIRDLPNVEVVPASTLEGLPLERVVAGFIPYRENVAAVDAITFPNKALRLLAHGLPLLIHGMPEFFQAPFVFRADAAAPAKDLETLGASFDRLQPEIRSFVKANTSAARLDQFLDYVS